MTKKLHTRNVFLDSEVFIRANFNYKSTALKHLSMLAKSGKAQIYLNPITIGEIKSNIEVAVKDAWQAQQKFQKQARILRNIKKESHNLFKELDMNYLIKALNSQFENFLKKNCVKIIPVYEKSLNNVFEKYFSRKPPFSEGKKKSEFPDAFVLASLYNWTEKNEEKIYLISNDGDIKSACIVDGPVISLETVEEFLDLLSAQEEELYEAVSQLYRTNLFKIEQEIGKRFESFTFYIADEEGTVESVKIKSVKERGTTYLLVKENSAIVESDFRIIFFANVIYSDPYNQIYIGRVDPMPYGNIEEKLERTASITAKLDLRYNLKDPPDFHIESLAVDNDQSIGVSVNIR